MRYWLNRRADIKIRGTLFRIGGYMVAWYRRWIIWTKYRRWNLRKLKDVQFVVFINYMYTVMSSDDHWRKLPLTLIRLNSFACGTDLFISLNSGKWNEIILFSQIGMGKMQRFNKVQFMIANLQPKQSSSLSYILTVSLYYFRNTMAWMDFLLIYRNICNSIYMLLYINKNAK